MVIGVLCFAALLREIHPSGSIDAANHAYLRPAGNATVDAVIC